MDKKNKVIVFGAGGFFQSRKTMLEKENEIICILDNYAKDNSFINNIPIYNPEKIAMLPEVQIIIMTEYFVDIIVQLGELLGEETCNKRVKIGSLYLPKSQEEKILKNANIRIALKNKKVFIIIDENIEIELKNNSHGIKKIYREYSREKDIFLQELIKMPLKPVDDSFGFKRGQPIDRYYIEKFLSDKKEYITGDCLEIAESTYTMKYGEERVKTVVILHVEGWGENVLKGNLETGEGIEDEKFDSMIITQTLMCTYNLENTVKSIHKALKQGGIALITVSAISKISRYDDEKWGYYHSFCKSGLVKLFTSIFGEKNVEIQCYGNIKTAIMFLYGGTAEELSTDELDYTDEDYPVCYGILVKKK